LGINNSLSLRERARVREMFVIKLSPQPLSRGERG
jgi:hypothetical protein